MKDQSDTNFDEVVHEVTKRLSRSFAPVSLSVERRFHPRHNDDRDFHGAHIFIFIESRVFHNKTVLQSHRLVYSVLDDMIPSEIHSVSIKTVPVSV